MANINDLKTQINRLIAQRQTLEARWTELAFAKRTKEENDEFKSLSSQLKALDKQIEALRLEIIRLGGSQGNQNDHV